MVKSRNAEPVRLVSGIPQSADVTTIVALLSSGQIPAVTPNGAVGLPRVAVLDRLRVIAMLISLDEKQDGSRSGGPQA
jgi:hypothetical protein